MLSGSRVDVVSIGNPYEWIHPGGTDHVSDLERAAELLGSQKAMLWPSPYGFPKVAVVLRAPSSELRDHVSSLLGVALPEVVCPRQRTDSICDDLLADREAFESLVALLDPEAGVHLAPYMQTPGVERVAAALEARGFELVERPRHSALVDRWSSKALIDLEVYRRDPAIARARPQSFVAETEDDLGRLFQKLFAAGLERVVVKTSRSAGGAGVFFVRLSDAVVEADPVAVLATRGVNVHHVEAPFLVEEEISWVFSPSVDLDVRPGGVVALIGCGIQRLFDRRYYAGFAATDEMYASPWFRDAFEVASRVADRFAREGFTGPLNFDFVVTAEGRVVLIETNVRRSALCDGFGLAELLGAQGALGRSTSRFSAVSVADYVESRWTHAPGELIAGLGAIETDGALVLSSDAALLEESPLYRWVSVISVASSLERAEAGLGSALGAVMGLDPDAAVAAHGALHPREVSPADPNSTGRPSAVPANALDRAPGIER
ncbi:MAG: hypothetical protein HYV07_07000 [Deltaproteobacteria bacterium]|nr:hypothetical protein [Deltaproteobacteria bacterium]